MLTDLRYFQFQAVLMFQVVMSRRTKKAYDKVFDHVNGVCTFTDLKIIMSDFEQPLRASIQEKFPRAQSVGCNVHFDRAIYAELKDLNIDVNDPGINLIIKKILALAFLPPENIQKQFLKLKRSMTVQQKATLKEFLKYFDSFWIKIVTPDGFSIYGMKHRTNNVSEQFNAEMLRALKKKPDTNTFILGVVKVMDKAYRGVQQMKNNASTRLIEFTSTIRESILRTIWLDFKNRKKKGIHVDDILVRIANLKGNLKDLINQPNEQRLEMGFTLKETPKIGQREADPDYDPMMECRRSLRQLRRQQNKEKILRIEAQLAENRRLARAAAHEGRDGSESGDSAVDVSGERDIEPGGDNNGRDGRDNSVAGDDDSEDGSESGEDSSEVEDDSDDDPDEIVSTTTDNLLDEEQDEEHHSTHNDNANGEEPPPEQMAPTSPPTASEQSDSERSSSPNSSDSSSDDEDDNGNHPQNERESRSHSSSPQLNNDNHEGNGDDNIHEDTSVFDASPSSQTVEQETDEDYHGNQVTPVVDSQSEPVMTPEELSRTKTVDGDDLRTVETLEYFPSLPQGKTFAENRRSQMQSSSHVISGITSQFSTSARSNTQKMAIQGAFRPWETKTVELAHPTRPNIPESNADLPQCVDHHVLTGTGSNYN
ncbi:hypothetical protein QAD02_020634 [Eretmocerus hayati]|uniref:Uncharacterized protein n=1 Tax=Eretmocerus hayati TaxID=131215 RepID=A0ACC2PP89_9HYME|nr:hypothetical protein QAD02_020634 [Eretmocerus hayati]